MVIKLYTWISTPLRTKLTSNYLGTCLGFSQAMNIASSPQNAWHCRCLLMACMSRLYKFPSTLNSKVVFGMLVPLVYAIYAGPPAPWKRDALYSWLLPYIVDTTSCTYPFLLLICSWKGHVGQLSRVWLVHSSTPICSTTLTSQVAKFWSVH